MTQDKRPTKAPKGDTLVEFTRDVNDGVQKGFRAITSRATADILVLHKKAKIVKEYAEGEVLKMAKSGKDYLKEDKK